MALASKSEEELLEWMENKDFPPGIIKTFKDNEMDGESLEALIATTPGPDCLKELIPKLGVRLRIYKQIKLSLTGAFSNPNLQEDDTGHVTDSSYKESSASTISGVSGSSSDFEIARLRREISSLSKEKASLLSELDNFDKEVGSMNIHSMLTPETGTSSSAETANSSSMIKSVKPKMDSFTSRSTSKSPSSSQDFPNPFPIPAFRHSAETQLKRGGVDESNRKYVVQTLATLLMTYKLSPSLKDCLKVSTSLHQKFKKLGDESSEGAWKWFIYNRCQNINRKSSDESDETQPRKKRKVDSTLKHEYPTIMIPEDADDDVSNKSNAKNLEEEWAKQKPDPQKLKVLFFRTHNQRRADVLSMKDSSTRSIFLKYPMLKKCSFAKIEFEIIMQRPDLKEHFDEEFILWSKAVVYYCKKKCTRMSTIQKLVKDMNVECNDDLLIVAARCLALLLIPTKTKEESGDIPFFMKFVPNETPVEDSPEPGNGQPHLVVITHDDYEQYFIAIEQKLYFESTDLATAVFFLLGCHYVLNLSYHQKLADLLRFYQEKIAGIASAQGTKWKSQVAITHIAGISKEYISVKKTDQLSESDSD